MKAVIDTNVIVSALLNPYGHPGSVLGLVIDENITPCYDSRILGEYIEVLTRPKFNFNKSDILAVTDFIEATGISVVAQKMNIRLKDPDDLPFAEVAAACEAEFLITGNTAHYPKKIGSTKVVTPSGFIRHFMRKRVE